MKFTLNDRWEKAVHGEIISDFKEGAIRNLFDNTMMDKIGYSNCVVISPISIQRYSYEQSLPIGFLVVLETNDSLKEEEILLIETISKNISPIINQMNLNQRIKNEYKPDPLKQFLSAVETKLAERREYVLEFYIYYKIVDKNPFEKSEGISIADQNCYFIDNFIFLLTYDKNDDDLFCEMPYIENINEVLNFDYKNFYYSYRNRLIEED